MYAANLFISDLSTGSLGLPRVAETPMGTTDQGCDFFGSESMPAASNIIITTFNPDFSVPKHYPFNQLDRAETILTKTQLQQEASIESSIASSVEAQVAYEQLAQAKQFLGLNILELASVLQVSRPTVYEWMDTKKITIRRKNQKRLNSIYEISKMWNTKHMGRLGSYLHKLIGASNISIFDLLKSNNLDIKKIHRCLDTIAQIILEKRHEDEAQEALLKKHGFEPVSEKDMEDRLNDIDFLD